MTSSWRNALLLALMVVTSSTVAAASESPVPSAWQRHVLVIGLHNLPKRYSCDELGYKFKDVLLALGAAPTMQILPYRCSARVGALAYSPTVQLRFSTPRSLSGAAASKAELQAVRQLTKLQPDTLPHVDGDDCALLSQMRSTLIKRLDDPVPTYRLPCQAPSSSVPRFSLTVVTLRPVRVESAPAVASASSPNSGTPATLGGSSLVFALHDDAVHSYASTNRRM